MHERFAERIEEGLARLPRPHRAGQKAVEPRRHRAPDRAPARAQLPRRRPLSDRASSRIAAARCRAAARMVGAARVGRLGAR